MLRTMRWRTLAATLLLVATVAVGASGCLLIPVGHDDDEHHGWHHHGRYEDGRGYEHHAWDYDRR